MRFLLLSLLMFSVLELGYAKSSHKKDSHSFFKRFQPSLFLGHWWQKIFSSPYELKEIDNNDTDLLEVELLAKKRHRGKPKYTPVEVLYKLVKKDKRHQYTSWKKSNISDFQFPVDLTDLEQGDYYLYARIASYKTSHMNRWFKFKRYHFTKMEFNKASSQNKLPLADFEIIEVDPQNKKVELHISYSDPDGVVVGGDLYVTSPSGQTVLLPTSDIVPYSMSEIGKHIFSVQVKDNDGGLSDIVYKEYVTQNSPPRVDFEVLVEDKSFQILPDISDLDGQIVSANIEIIDPQGEVTQKAFNETVTYSGTKSGRYRIIARATDDQGASDQKEQTVQLEFINSPPVAVIEVENESYKQFDVIEFSAESSSDPENHKLSYQWIFEDGTIKEDAIIYHFFENIGPTVVTLKVTDEEGLESTTQKVIEITQGEFASPIAKMELSGELDSLGRFLGEVRATAARSELSEGEVDQILWDVGDGTTYEGMHFVHKYEQVGTYLVQLTITSTLGASASISQEVTIANLENPKLIKTSYDVLVQGVDLEGRNPLEMPLSISLSEEGNFDSEGYAVEVNNESQTEKIEFRNGNLEGVVLCEEGNNIIRIYGFDQNKNYVEKEFVAFAGGESFSVTVKDPQGLAVAGAKLELSMLGESEKETYTTDNNGVVQIDNATLDDSYFVANKDGMSTISYIEKSKTSYEVFLEQPENFPEIYNLEFEGPNANWQMTQETVSFLTRNDGFRYANILVGPSQEAVLAREFTYNGYEFFLTTNIDVENLNENHTIQIEIINYTSGDSYVRNISKLETIESMQDFINIKAGDAVKTSVRVIPKSVVKTNSVLEFLKKQFSAYAQMLPDESTKIKFEQYQNWFEYEAGLKDLNRHNTYNDKENNSNEFSLTPLTFLSVGDYVDRENESPGNDIYFTFKIRNLLFDAEFWLDRIEIVDKEGNKLIETNENSTLENSKAVYDIDPAHFYPTLVLKNTILPTNLQPNDENYERYSRINYIFNGIDYAQDKTYVEEIGLHRDPDEKRFVPYFKIPNNTIKPSDKPTIRIYYKLRQPGTNNVIALRPFEKSFGKSQVLVNHKLPFEKRYFARSSAPDGILNRDSAFNLTKPDYGDHWVTERTKKVVKALTSIGGLDAKVGDVTNVNGHEKLTKDDKGAYFQPHGWHYDGKRFDLQTKHFFTDPYEHQRSEYLFKSRVFLDLLKIASNETLKNNISKVGITYEKDSRSPENDYMNEYQNFCINGKTVESITHEIKRNHRDHFHIRTTETGNPPVLVNNNPMAKGFTKPTAEFDFENKRVKYTFKIDAQNRRGSVFLYKKNLNGLYDEVYFSLEDNEYREVGDNVVIEHNQEHQGGVLSINLYVKLESLYWFKQHYRLFINEVNTEDGKIGQCYGEEFDFSTAIDIDDCNNDGIDDDPAHLRTDSFNRWSFVAEGVDFPEQAWVYDGARLCKGTQFLSKTGIVAGSNVVLENTVIGANCDSFNVYGENKDSRNIIKDSQFCTQGDDGVNMSVSFYNTSNSHSIENSIFNSPDLRLNNVNISSSSFSAGARLSLSDSYLLDSHMQAEEIRIDKSSIKKLDSNYGKLSVFRSEFAAGDGKRNNINGDIYVRDVKIVNTSLQSQKVSDDIAERLNIYGVYQNQGSNILVENSEISGSGNIGSSLSNVEAQASFFRTSGSYIENTIFNFARVDIRESIVSGDSNNKNLLTGGFLIYRSTLTNTKISGATVMYNGQGGYGQGGVSLSDSTIENSNLSGTFRMSSSTAREADISGDIFYMNNLTNSDHRSLTIKDASIYGNAGDRVEISGNSSIYGTIYGDIHGYSHSSFNSNISNSATFYGTVPRGCYYKIDANVTAGGSVCNQILSLSQDGVEQYPIENDESRIPAGGQFYPVDFGSVGISGAGLN